MEDILASIKKVIAEDKDARTAQPSNEVQQDYQDSADDDVLELEEEVALKADAGPPLIDAATAGATRSALDQLSTVAASAPPPPQGNPLEDMIREMLRPMLKQWLDDNLPRLVDEHVKREISRITGRPV
ncbi:DUF2497 domain-containing protein [Sphingomonas daechungensis]|uniref:DUF2497 domain-containing protein n=2 Tax=Sphingomonas daechungensis TaxID=1176646 RepID=A0ABX6T377_9SPHN|nr:DUF2497 domain-containing protein [Sphingomonas daechungensis]